MFVHYTVYQALQNDLQRLEKKKMNELCSNWKDSDLIFTCCQTLEPCVMAILPKFSLLARASGNEIFINTWKKHLNVALQSTLTSTRSLTQEDVCTMVWMPTVEFCQCFVTELKNKTMLLSRIEEIFGGDCEVADIETYSVSLVKALSSCFPEQVSPNTNWIKPVCKQIEHFHLSLKCTKCAKAILQVQSHLELTGDFRLIKDLANQV